jgi:hypothetical protein
MNGSKRKEEVNEPNVRIEKREVTKWTAWKKGRGKQTACQT